MKSCYCAYKSGMCLSTCHTRLPTIHRCSSRAGRMPACTSLFNCVPEALQEFTVKSDEVILKEFARYLPLLKCKFQQHMRWCKMLMPVLSNLGKGVACGGRGVVQVCIMLGLWAHVSDTLPAVVCRPLAQSQRTVNYASLDLTCFASKPQRTVLCN